MSHLNPWIIAIVLVVLALAWNIVSQIRHNRKVATSRAKRYQEWSVEAVASVQRFYAAREAAITAFLCHSAGLRHFAIMTSVSEPLDCYDCHGYTKGDKNRNGLGYPWKVQLSESDPWRICIDNLVVKYAPRFAKYAAHPIKMLYDDTLFVDLLQELVLRKANRQVMELTRSWLLPHENLLKSARADAAAGRIPDTNESLNAVVNAGLERQRMAREQKYIDIYKSAQEEFDQLLKKMQNIIDQNRQGIDDLRLRILSQECKHSGPYEKDRTQYGRMTQHMSEEDVTTFFAKYEEGKTVQDARAVS